MVANVKCQDLTYTPVCKPNQLICGTGQVAIVTGWTVKSLVAKRLDPSQFAVIGQLYSPTRGISLLVRNLLANPHVRFLVVLAATREDENSGASLCLLDFFRKGCVRGFSDTGKECWVINSSLEGYVDVEIDLGSIDLLRASIEVFSASSISEAVDLVRELAKKTPVSPWGTPLFFDQQSSVPVILPGPQYGHRIEGKTIAETWVKIVHRIKTTGVIRPTGYDGYWQELIDLVAVVTDEPDGFYFPDPNYLPCGPDFVGEYVNQLVYDSETGEGVKYTYGQRLRSHFKKDQVEQVIQKLIAEIDAASAVMSLWDVKDHDMGGSPCLNHVWVRVVNQELSLTAVFRSNDMFSAWPANAIGLRALQKHIFQEIKNRSKHELKLGPLLTISQSAHIYDDCWDNADRLISQQYLTGNRKTDYNDPSGNFLLEIIDNEVVVTQTTSGSGEIVKRFHGKNPLKMIREISLSSPAIWPAHIGYLGMELQKAFTALQEGSQYVQDQ